MENREGEGGGDSRARPNDEADGKSQSQSQSQSRLSRGLRSQAGQLVLPGHGGRLSVFSRHEGR